MPSFLSELNRRNVIRVALFYVIAAWLILQVLDVIGEILAFPVWLAQGVLVLLALGFIPALLFAWVYELTPEGIKREKEIEREESITHQTARRMDVAVIVLLVPAIGLLLWQQLGSPQAPATESPVVESAASPPQPAQDADIARTEQVDEPRAPQKSIAVLPFANRSNREEDLFFTDGIHDDLLTQLAKISSLTVISRTSVMRYRDTDLPIPDIATQLGVANILEGGIQRAGDQVRINVQLIEAATDRHLWAETYDRQLTTDNLFAIQSEITRQIVDALKGTLSTEEARRIDKRPTDNLEAFQEFLRGQQLLPLRTVAAIEAGRAHFERALELDPEFPEATVGLANALHLLNEYAGWPAETSLEPAMKLVDRALADSPDLADGYLVKGELHRHAREFELAEAAFERALALAPSNPTAHQWYGMLASQQDQQEKAFSLLRRAHELDPMSPVIHLNYAIIPFQLGRDEETLAELDRIKLLHPNFPSTYTYEAWIHFNHGDAVRTLRASLKAQELDPASTRVAWVCGPYIALNALAEADACFQSYSGPDIPDVHLLRAYYQLLRGDADAARSELQAALALESGQPEWASLAINLNDFGLARRLLELRDAAWLSDAPLEVDDEMDIFDANRAINASAVLLNEGRSERGHALLGAALRGMEDNARARGMEAKGWSDASAYAWLGDRENALRAIEAVAEIEFLSGWQELKFAPEYDFIRDDLRFVSAISRLEEAADHARERARAEGLL